MEKSNQAIPDAFPTPETKPPLTGIDHIVFVDSIGGATVLSSESLQFKNLEMIFNELTEETVKNSILHFRPHLGDIKDLNITVIDNREKHIKK